MTWVGKVAPPWPTMPAFLTISTSCSGVRLSGSATGLTSSETSSWKSFSMTTDIILPPIVEGTGLHGLHRAGDAGVDGGGNKSAGFADPLSNFYLVAHRNDRLARRTDVHRHGNDHLSRRRQLFDGLFIGCGLHVVRMNAAKESLCHCLHLILLPGGPLPPHTIQILQQNFSLVQSYGAIPVVFCRFYRGLDGVSREISPHFPASAKKSAVPAALRRPLCFRRRCVRILAHRGRNTFGPRAERMGHHAS